MPSITAVSSTVKNRSIDITSLLTAILPEWNWYIHSYAAGLVLILSCFLVMMNLPELVGTQLFLFFKDGAEIVRIAKTGQIGDFLNLYPGVLQEELFAFPEKTAGPAVRLGFDREELRLEAKAGYQKLFTIRAKDSEGTTVFRDSSKVTFNASGPAEIVAVDNGDLSSSESYDAHWMHMYRGCVSAVIRFTGEPGRVVLSAYSEGMHPAEHVIHVM